MFLKKIRIRVEEKRKENGWRQKGKLNEEWRSSGFLMRSEFALHSLPFDIIYKKNPFVE